MDSIYRIIHRDLPSYHKHIFKSGTERIIHVLYRFIMINC